MSDVVQSVRQLLQDFIAPELRDALLALRPNADCNGNNLHFGPRFPLSYTR
jgi:hypothetical protein